MKKFIGGYYKENLDMDQKGLAFEEVLVLTLKEALDHPAIENVAENYNETKNKEFYELSEEEQMKEIENYILFDEIFGGRFYEESEVEETVAEFEENAKNYED